MQNSLGPLPIDHRDFLLNREIKDMPPIAFKAYILLLCEMWENGPLPKNMDKLAEYSGVSRTIFTNKIWDHIRLLFFEVDDLDGTKYLDHEFTHDMRKKAIKALVARKKMSAAASKRANRA